MDEEYGFNFKWNESKWLTRQSLLVRMENADEYVLDEFFRKYLPFIVMIAKKVKLSYQDTKELIDMVYDDIRTKGIANYSGKSRFHTWFNRVIRNKIFDIWRKHGRAKEIPTDDFSTQEEETAEDAFSNDCRAVWRDMLRYSILVELKEELPSSHYQAFYLAAVQGRKSEDVATVSNLSAANVRKIVSRVKEGMLLRYRQLQKEYPLEDMNMDELLEKTQSITQEYRKIQKEYSELFQ